MGELVKYTVVALMITLLLLLGLVLFSEYRIRSGGRVRSIKISVYKDADLTTKLEFMDWSIMNPGDSKNYSTFVYNYGQSTLNFSLYSENFEAWDTLLNGTLVHSSVNVSMYVTFDYYIGNVTLESGDVQHCIVQCNISPYIHGIDVWNCDLVFVGSEPPQD